MKLFLDHKSYVIQRFKLSVTMGMLHEDITCIQTVIVY
jgi:hypothetical protein